MLVAACSLPAAHEAADLALGGQLHLAHMLPATPSSLPALPLACDSWHTVVSSLCLWPLPCPALFLTSWSSLLASLIALLQLPPPAFQPQAVSSLPPMVLACSHISPVVHCECWSPGSLVCVTQELTGIQVHSQSGFLTQ